MPLTLTPEESQTEKALAGTMPSTRKILLDVVASFDADTPQDVCDAALDEIFTGSSFATNVILDCDSCDGGVTPLIIICDKSITSAVNFLRNQINHLSSREVSVWGCVTDKSTESGNCAAHHALAANFRTGLDLLESYLFSTPHSSSHESSLQRYMSLLGQPNENGDTPIMMACCYGHFEILRHVLKRSFYLASTDRNGYDDELTVRNAWQSLYELFSKRNAEGCSALNLACGHGHVDIVRLLIHAHFVHENGDSMKVCDEFDSNESDTVHKLMPLITVTYNDDVKRCQSILDNLKVGLKMMKQKSIPKVKQEEFQKQYNNIMECFELLNNELDRIAAETASSLLIQDEGSQDQFHSTKKINGKTSKSKKKKKSKKSNRIQDNKSISQKKFNIVSEAKELTERTRDVWCVDTKSSSDTSLTRATVSSPFITLQDGRVISKSQTHEVVPCEDVAVETLMNTNSTPKTLESVLQSNSRYDDTTATIMESLCLDPSMLLLSAHGMAMKMSPCQLDTIERILTQQLRSCKEAQRIQSRLLSKSK